MKRILIDTNFYTAFKKNQPRTLNILRKVEYIGINIIVLGELLGGFKGGNKEEKNREELNKFLDTPRVHIIQLDEETSEFYAKVYAKLKKAGKPIPTNDIWVAATALRYGLTLLTFDEHFNYIEGLMLMEDIF